MGERREAKVRGPYLELRGKVLVLKDASAVLTWALVPSQKRPRQEGQEQVPPGRRSYSVGHPAAVEESEEGPLELDLASPELQRGRGRGRFPALVAVLDWVLWLDPAFVPG